MERTTDPARQGRISRMVMKRPRLIVTLCFVCAMTLVGLVGLRQLYAMTRDDLQSRQRDLEVRAVGVGVLIAAERHRLLLLSYYAQHMLESVGPQPAGRRTPTPPNDAFADTDQPAWRVPGELGGPSVFGTNGAGLAGLDGFARDAATLPADLALARTISPLLAISQRDDAVQKTVAFISSNGLYVVSPERKAADVETMLHRFNTMPYYRDQLPDRNPRRKLVWTPVYTEFQNQDAISTLSAPVYANNRFRGALVMDVIPSHLLRLQLSSGAPPDEETGANFAMLNTSGNLVYFHDDNMTSQRPREFGESLLHVAHASIDRWLRAGKGVVHRGGQYLLYQRVGDTQWLLMTTTDNGELIGAAARRLFNNPLIVAWVALAVLLVGTLRIVTNIFGHYVEASARLEVLARNDPLTGLANRRRFQEAFAEAIERAGRMHDASASIALLMIDIDFFKRVNDRWGHAAGDRVLEILADLMRANLRSVDLPARIGGEEFAALLPDTDLAAAAAVAERLRRAVEAHSATHGGKADAARPETIPFSVSIGVAASPEDGPAGYEALLPVADRRLYHAKESGRNRVVCTDTPEPGQVSDQALPQNR